MYRLAGISDTTFDTVDGACMLMDAYELDRLLEIDVFRRHDITENLQWEKVCSSEECFLKLVCDTFKSQEHVPRPFWQSPSFTHSPRNCPRLQHLLTYESEKESCDKQKVTPPSSPVSPDDW
jgi:hypothetical protein